MLTPFSNAPPWVHWQLLHHLCSWQEAICFSWNLMRSLGCTCETASYHFRHREVMETNEIGALKIIWDIFITIVVNMSSVVIMNWKPGYTLCMQDIFSGLWCSVILFVRQGDENQTNFTSSTQARLFGSKYTQPHCTPAVEVDWQTTSLMMLHSLL